MIDEQRSGNVASPRHNFDLWETSDQLFLAGFRFFSGSGLHFI